MPEPQIKSIIVPDLREAMDFFIQRLGFRLEMILPADTPDTAVVSGQGVTLRLQTQTRSTEESNAEADKIITNRLQAVDGWHEGRAGMQYRDLIPGRLGGRLIASHIRIPNGGPVSDYVHYHRIGFQMIYCKSGWVRVVYEDQGAPFVLEAGDCVLQPPEIRHRVLESSPGLEVIEVGCPALHETWVDYELQLPTKRFLPERIFSGQRFVRHRVVDAAWLPWRKAGFEACDIGISAATDKLVSAHVIRSKEESALLVNGPADKFLFWFILRGEMRGEHPLDGQFRLRENDCCVIPPDYEISLKSNSALKWLEVSINSR